MRLEEFDYQLPEEFIAQTPIEPRDASRLMVLDRTGRRIHHRVFRELPSFLTPGDVLVLNDTKVMPARLIGEKAGTGGRAELLLLQRRTLDRWEALVRPGRRLQPGARLTFGGGILRAEIQEKTASGGRVVRFAWQGSFEEVLDRLGEVPLPPYIKAQLPNAERYQTVYAREQGSAAAPTAGLHFTERLLAQIEEMGVRIVRITLHVGLGTFRPVVAERPKEHRMHSEYYRVPEETAAAVRAARESGRRVVAVGTTVARTLETCADSERTVSPGAGWTDIFIFPGYTFCCVDALITNFHLPRSTLLMLVSAFADKEFIFEAYEEAKKKGYRFFSFGDAMLLQ